MARLLKALIRVEIIDIFRVFYNYWILKRPGVQMCCQDPWARGYASMSFVKTIL